MKKNILFGISCLLFLTAVLVSCTEDIAINDAPGTSAVSNQSILNVTFGSRINLSNLDNYANQSIPGYVTHDNQTNNTITDIGATLGRVLFYDKNLSIDNTISCASCHQQAFAFSDPAQASVGVNGSTGRHSMRLVNARFAEEIQFFWDERANTLEVQTTQPIQDHIEMGFSGQDGDPGITDLISKLSTLNYYPVLFEEAFGDETITETRMQSALAQFVRSIQSFDAKYDIGRAQVNNDMTPFPNFTDEENQGKQLFLGRPTFNNAGIRTGGGLGCGGCHRAPEFDIAPNSRNNGVIASLDQSGTDDDVTRSPSLRDAVNANGQANGPFMHTGSFATFDGVLTHYNQIQLNPGLDNRLRPEGNAQNLSITQNERNAMIAFIQTLTGTDVYTNSKWSDPFQ